MIHSGQFCNTGKVSPAGDNTYSVVKSMSVVLICGANSGIGRRFAIAFSQRPEVHTIYALDHSFPSPQDSSSKSDLVNLAPSKIKTIPVDVTKEQEVHQACDRISHELNTSAAALDVVIYSAGVRGLDPAVSITQFSDVSKAETLHTMSVETMERTLRTNSVGTFIFLRALIPLLRKSNDTPTKVVVMSSRMGSIGHNNLGGSYAYRASKAAQNALVRSMAADVPEVCWLLVHPGRVETGLVVVKEDGAMSAEESVADMMKLIDNTGRERSGHFVDRFGVAIPW